jgi:hypothetical protein
MRRGCAADRARSEPNMPVSRRGKAERPSSESIGRKASLVSCTVLPNPDSARGPWRPRVKLRKSLLGARPDSLGLGWSRSPGARRRDAGRQRSDGSDEGFSSSRRSARGPSAGRRKASQPERFHYAFEASPSGNSGEGADANKGSGARRSGELSPARTDGASRVLHPRRCSASACSAEGRSATRSDPQHSHW